MQTGEFLNAPCIFCGYNGQGYFQERTHDKNCPWYNVGGLFERGEMLPKLIRKSLRAMVVQRSASDNTPKAKILLKEKLAGLMVDWVKLDNGARYRMVSECVAELSALC